MVLLPWRLTKAIGRLINVLFYDTGDLKNGFMLQEVKFHRCANLSMHIYMPDKRQGQEKVAVGCRPLTPEAGVQLPLGLT